jgi:hypothetical protein
VKTFRSILKVYLDQQSHLAKMAATTTVALALALAWAPWGWAAQQQI